MASWEDEVDPKVPNYIDNFSKIDIDAPEFIPGKPYNFSEFEIPRQLIPESDEKHIESDNIPIGGDIKVTEGLLSTYDALSEDAGIIECERKKEVKPYIPPEDRKETLSLVFIGHVDAGKSTIGGHLLHLTGMVDKRTLEKYAREAKEKNRETWYLSWALDTNLEERDKGKTVECGRAFFETENKHFILVDAPGHKSFVPNMISGASIADLAILVISARRGEFETGFEKGGQTREHAMLVKTAGVRHIIVLINKMDDPTVKWDETRFNECRDKLIPCLKKLGFNMKTEVYFMPCSGYTGAFLRDSPPESVCSWYNGSCLLKYLDDLPPLTRNIDGPLRIPITDRYRDMGTYVVGKIESGTIFRGQSVILMPNRVIVDVLQVMNDDVEVEGCQAGENVKLKLKNVEEEDISPGFVLCSSDNLCHVCNIFDAQVVIVDCKSIICPGFSAVMHVHACMEEVRFRTIICRIDKKTNKKTDIRPRFIKQDDLAIVRFETLGGAVCVECFKDFPQMGRFTLRDEGKTIAVGKILKILPSSTVE